MEVHYLQMLITLYTTLVRLIVCNYKPMVLYNIMPWKYALDLVFFKPKRSRMREYSVKERGGIGGQFLLYKSLSFNNNNCLYCYSLKLSSCRLLNGQHQLKNKTFLDLNRYFSSVCFIKIWKKNLHLVKWS